MFNHARTLLLNRDGNQTPGPDYLAEELVPEGFRAVRLSDTLQHFRAWLFGTTPDRAMLNYRLRQYLALLHSTELVQFVLALDPRITYELPNESGLVAREAFLPEVNQVAGAAAQLSILGTQTAPDAIGRLRYDFDVDVLLDDTIEIKRLTPPTTSDIHDLVLTNGLSAAFPLRGTGYSCTVNTTNPGAHWTIGGYLRPQWELGYISNTIRQTGEPFFLDLFGVAPREPYRTFANLWWDHLELPYRLGGLLLAIIYRTEEARRRNG